MKTKKHADRKTAIESTLKAMRKVSGHPNDCQQAWLRLVREMEFMADPEARMPRFKGLMHAVWIAATNDHT